MMPTDSEPTKQARIWSKVVLAVAGGALAGGAGAHFYEKPKDTDAISNAVTVAVERSIGPLRDEVNQLGGRVRTLEAYNTVMNVQLVPRVDALSAKLDNIVIDVSYMRGKAEFKSRQEN